ncbi:hypothetical protein C8J57DRAFT_1589999 [Mycena rebaudengoi]|nr:hypothetical protein C8J57DRAFT_1589999 [Mycena rebaudengoi]
MANEFPQEIIDAIVGKLGGDTASLKACSLTATPFVAPTRSQLFHSIGLKMESSIERAHDLITSCPSAAWFFRTLTLNLERATRDQLQRAVPNILGALDNIETLALLRYNVHSEPALELPLLCLLSNPRFKRFRLVSSCTTASLLFSALAASPTINLYDACVLSDANRPTPPLPASPPPALAALLLWKALWEIAEHMSVGCCSKRRRVSVLTTTFPSKNSTCSTLPPKCAGEGVFPGPKERHGLYSHYTSDFGGQRIRSQRPPQDRLEVRLRLQRAVQSNASHRVAPDSAAGAQLTCHCSTHKGSMRGRASSPRHLMFMCYNLQVNEQLAFKVLQLLSLHANPPNIGRKLIDIRLSLNAFGRVNLFAVAHGCSTTTISNAPAPYSLSTRQLGRCDNRDAHDVRGAVALRRREIRPLARAHQGPAPPRHQHRRNLPHGLQNVPPRTFALAGNREFALQPSEPSDGCIDRCRISLSTVQI